MDAATEALVRDARDFFHAVDRGDYGDALMHDGVESAYLRAMRSSLAVVSAQRQAEMFEEDYRRPVADLWGEIHRRTFQGRR